MKDELKQKTSEMHC